MTERARREATDLGCHTRVDRRAFVIEGDLINGGTTHGPNAFLVAKIGEPHGPHTPAGRCVLPSIYRGKPTSRRWSRRYANSTVPAIPRGPS